jgi:hypothetical protein
VSNLSRWPRAERLDARRIADAISAAAGVALRIEGPCPGPAATRRLDQILDGFPPDVLVPMWAHMSLRMTDWAIRHFIPADVDYWLDLAEQRAI